MVEFNKDFDKEVNKHLLYTVQQCYGCFRCEKARLSSLRTTSWNQVQTFPSTSVPNALLLDIVIENVKEAIGRLDIRRSATCIQYTILGRAISSFCEMLGTRARLAFAC